MSLHNTSYCSNSSLANELATIFKFGWQFIAMSDELKNNKDFVTLEFPDDTIVVQNFRGELRAFQNICPHRLNIIQTDERGNRQLTCRYHSWSFNSDGFPIGIGERQGFVDNDEDRSKLCLTQYRVSTCGKFVFISREAAGQSLDEFLGPFAKVLRDLSDHIGGETFFGPVKHQANWKLLVENVLECYHCASVHPDTFITGLGVGRKPISNVEMSAQGHSSSHFPRMPIKREALRKKIISHLDDRGFIHDSFYHIHIFPNLFISSTEGTSFYVGHAVPLSADQTSLRVRFFEPAVELTESGRARQDAINLQSSPLGLRVIEEDRLILENQQRGLNRTQRQANTGNEEIRIAHFQKSYSTFIKNDYD